MDVRGGRVMITQLLLRSESTQICTYCIIVIIYNLNETRSKLFLASLANESVACYLGSSDCELRTLGEW